MDSLDTRLVRELSQGRNVGLVWGDINPAYGEMAGRLGVSQATIRERMKKMRASGMLRLFPIQANPELLGLSMGAALIDFPAPASKEDLLRKVALVDGVLLMVLHVGPSLGIIYYYEDEAARRKKVELISRICSATASVSTRIPYPKCITSLSRLDWEIIRAMQRDRSVPAQHVSKELGISEKTLKRHVKRLIEGWAISTLISTDVDPLRGTVTANLIVYYSSPDLRQAADSVLLKELDEYLFFPGLWSDYSAYSLFLPSIPEANRILDRTRRTPGVAGARIELVEERVECYSILIEQVERKLRTLQDRDK